MGIQQAALYGEVEKPRQLTLPRTQAGTQLHLEVSPPGDAKAVVVEVVEVVVGVSGGNPLLGEILLKAGTQ